MCCCFCALPAVSVHGQLSGPHSGLLQAVQQNRPCGRASPMTRSRAAAAEHAAPTVVTLPRSHLALQSSGGASGDGCSAGRLRPLSALAIVPLQPCSASPAGRVDTQPHCSAQARGRSLDGCRYQKHAVIITFSTVPAAGEPAPLLFVELSHRVEDAALLAVASFVSWHTHLHGVHSCTSGTGLSSQVEDLHALRTIVHRWRWAL